MERQYKHLSSPITIGRKTFRNRMFSAPMGGTDITNDGCIGPKSTAFYELRAKGGAAAVTVSECMVHKTEWLTCLPFRRIYFKLFSRRNICC